MSTFEARRIFIHHLKRLRKVHGFSLDDMHEKTGLSYNYLCQLEKLRTNISLDNMEKIASAFHVPLYMMLLPPEE